MERSGFAMTNCADLQSDPVLLLPQIMFRRCIVRVNNCIIAACLVCERQLIIACNMPLVVELVHNYSVLRNCIFFPCRLDHFFLFFLKQRAFLSCRCPVKKPSSKNPVTLSISC
ncbi:hypothetical protein VPH35_064617 [Triticum aestivum]